jgi:Mg-chelatase subunit ChlD
LLLDHLRRLSAPLSAETRPRELTFSHRRSSIQPRSDEVKRTSIVLGTLIEVLGGIGCDPGSVGQEKQAQDAGTFRLDVDALGTGKSGTLTGAGGRPSGFGTTGTATQDFARCTSKPIDGGCVGSLYTGQAVGLDIFIMFDESGSMATKDDGTTMRMDAVRGAVGQFLQAPASAGLGVGIGYFGTQSLTCACTSCKPDDYATPAVPVGVLPAQGTALIASLAAAAPTGETPTGAAVRGACSYARQVAAARPGHDVVVLLVTDGEPQAPLTSAKGTCSPTLEDAVAAATECRAGATAIRTYVLGVGPSLQKLNQIAAAGGTTQAYLVESGGGTEVLQALNRIRTDAQIPCALQLPQSGAAALDLDAVNLVYADQDCTMTTIGMVESADACNAQLGGWYYDDPSRPTSIRLCDTSCKQVSAPGGQLKVSVGCRTELIF